MKVAHNVTGAAEPDLELTDDLALIAASNTGANEATGYMGRLTDLLAWHQADPVDDLERARNDVVEAAQGNRNPFIDRPEYALYLFSAENDSDADGVTNDFDVCPNPPPIVSTQNYL